MKNEKILTIKTRKKKKLLYKRIHSLIKQEMEIKTLEFYRGGSEQIVFEVTFYY